MDKTIADKLIYNPNDNTHNYPFCGFNLLVKIFGHSTKETNQSKFNKSYQRLRKHYNKTLGTSVINSLMSPPSMVKSTCYALNFNYKDGMFVDVIVQVRSGKATTMHREGGDIGLFITLVPKVL